MFVVYKTLNTKYSKGDYGLMSKLLIVNGSPRKDGVCARLAKIIEEDVKKYGYETKIVNVCSMDINGCKACMACKKTGCCAQKDDMTQLYDEIRSSDMIVIEAPIYFGAESGQIKCFIDRFYAMVGMKDGQRTVDIGNVKKASVVLACGAPDGNMTYGGVIGRYTKVFKSLGITDFSGAILNNVAPEETGASPKTQDYLSNLEFQLEM